MALVQAPNALLGKHRREDVLCSVPDTVKRARRSRTASNLSVSDALDCSPDHDSTSDFEIDSTPATPSAQQSQPTPPTTPTSRTSQGSFKYRCTFSGCDRSFSRPVRLEEHIRSHTNERPFKCPHPPCDKDFRRQTHLSHHIKSAHTSQRDYVCDWQGCNKKFATGTRLKRHIQAHEKRDAFRCIDYPPCNKTFRKHSTLQRHIDADHLHLKPFLCQRLDDRTGEQCSAAFDSAAGRRAHEARCHQGKQYWCSICTESTGDDTAMPRQNTGFATYAELQVHMKLLHPPQCEHCGLSCSTAGELQRHIDLHHSGTTLEDRRSFKCPEPGCGKGFTKQGNLNIHIRSTHEKKKPFVCGETDLRHSAGLESWDASNACHRGFTAKASLETHVRKFHLDPARAPPKSVPRRPAADVKTYKQLPSTSTRLTGAGYAQESGRTLVCPMPACEHRFKRHADLRGHTRAAHGLAEAETAEALAESEALSGGRFWLGGADELVQDRRDNHNDIDDDDDSGDEEDWRELTGFDKPAVNIGGGGAYGFSLSDAEPRALDDRDAPRLPQPELTAQGQTGGDLASVITSCLAADDVVDPALLGDTKT